MTEKLKPEAKREEELRHRLSGLLANAGILATGKNRMLYPTGLDEQLRVIENNSYGSLKIRDSATMLLGFLKRADSRIDEDTKLEIAMVWGELFGSGDLGIDEAIRKESRIARKLGSPGN